MSSKQEALLYRGEHKNDVRNLYGKIIPICIVVDISHSMTFGKQQTGYSRMDRLNDGINLFIQELKDRPDIADCSEIAIVTYGNQAEIFQQFTFMDKIKTVHIDAGRENGNTPVGVNLGLSLLNNEKKFLKDNSKAYKQPWIVIFSDGKATPKSYKNEYDQYVRDFTQIRYELQSCQDLIKSQERENKLNVIPVLISDSNEKSYYEALDEMRNFRNDKQALILDNDGEVDGGKSFSDFFKVLASSVSADSAKLMFGNDNFELKDDYKKTVISQDEFLNDSQVEVLLGNTRQTKTVTLKFKFVCNQNLMCSLTKISIKDLSNGKDIGINFNDNNVPGIIAGTIDIDKNSKKIYVTYSIEIYKEADRNNIYFKNTQTATCDLIDDVVEILAFEDYEDQYDETSDIGSSEDDEISLEENDAAFEFEEPEVQQVTKNNQHVSKNSVIKEIEKILSTIDDWDDI